jgi:hypothetical protein
MKLSRRFATALPIALAASFAAPSAFATEARIRSMGGGFKLWTIEDESNIFDFPSLLTRWGNRAYIDNLQPGSDNGELFPEGRFGFHYNLSDDTVLAFIGANSNTTTRGQSSGYVPTGNAITGGQAMGIALQAALANGTGGGTDARLTSEFRYGLMFATTLGATTRFGVQLSISGDNNDVESPNNAQLDQGSFLMDLGLGLGFDLDGSELELAAGVEIGVLEDNRDGAEATTGVPGDLLEHWSGSHVGIRLNGRWTFDFFDQTKIVAYTQFLYGSQSLELVNTASIPAERGSYSGLRFSLGADLRIEPFQDVIVSPGLGIFLAQQTIESPNVVDRDADQLLALPYYGIAVDVKLADWFDLRFGAQQHIVSERLSTTAGGVTNTSEETEVFTTFALGVGFNIPVSESQLAIDLALNPTFLTNGPHVLTGNSTGPFAVNAAVRYNW